VWPPGPAPGLLLEHGPLDVEALGGSAAVVIGPSSTLLLPRPR
jgi:hypothetical protein